MGRICLWIPLQMFTTENHENTTLNCSDYHLVAVVCMADWPAGAARLPEKKTVESTGCEENSAMIYKTQGIARRYL